MVCANAEFVTGGVYICGFDGNICPDPEDPCGDEDLFNDYDEDDDWNDEEE
jgi:hypothetical protein